MSAMPTQADVAEFLLSGFSHYECREIVEAASGYKLSRLLITRHKAGVLGAWASRRGLVFDTGDFDVHESREPEGKGSWINEGSRAPRGDGLCFAYLGCRSSDVQAAAASDNAGEEPFVLGELFRIPLCCTNFYSALLEDARESYDNDYAPLISRGAVADGPFPWMNNYLSQYFGHSLIHHYPCRWDCEASLDRAGESLALMDKVSPAWAAHTRDMLTGTVFHAGREGVHMIRGFVASRGGTYRADQVVSTTYDSVCADIKAEAGNDLDQVRKSWEGLRGDVLRLGFA